ncbi:MAG TPA: acyl carrier protein [Rhizomicrobium sp.]|nr:acyl carrier protein [Rhizomicrobium sp.]
MSNLLSGHSNNDIAEGTRNALYEIFVREIRLNPEDFTEELTYNSIPEWDSQAHILLVLAIEEKFGIEIQPEEVVRITSVRKMLDLLKSKGVA